MCGTKSTGLEAARTHARTQHTHPVIMVVLRIRRADHYIFALWFLSFFFFSLPNLSGRRLDVYHTSTHVLHVAR